MEILYEAKFEIPKDSEAEIAAKFGFEFDKEYSDSDLYLKTDQQGAFKIKHLGGKYIQSTVALEGEIFNITLKDIDPQTAGKLFQEHPMEAEIHRRKRKYTWPRYRVSCSFDYMQELPDLLFLEIHANEKESVAAAQNFLKEQGFTKIILTPYNQLLR